MLEDSMCYEKKEAKVDQNKWGTECGSKGGMLQY